MRRPVPFYTYRCSSKPEEAVLGSGSNCSNGSGCSNSPWVDELLACWRRDIPRKYQFVLNGLKPDPISQLPMAEQEKLYREVQEEHIFDGWAFFAPAGYSKTTCSYRLYAQAIIESLWHWDAFHYQAHNWPGQPGYNGKDTTPRIYVWRKSVPDLLQQHYDKISGKDVEPDITVEKIEDAIKSEKHAGKFIPKVFLEEIDKIKPSEFATNQLFRIIDALDRHKGQLVLDTNMTGEQFENTFGSPIARRVKEMCHVKEYGF